MDKTASEKTEKHLCVGLLAHVDAGKTTLAEAILYLTGRIRKLGRVDHQDAFLDHFEMERARGITIFSKQAQAVLSGGDEESHASACAPGASSAGSVTSVRKPGVSSAGSVTSARKPGAYFAKSVTSACEPGASSAGIRASAAGSDAHFAEKQSVLLTLLDTPGHVDFSAEMERTLQVLDYAILVISGADGVQSHVETLWRLLNRYKIPVFLFVNKMDQPGTDHDALFAELTKKLDARCVDFTPERNSEEFQEAFAMCSEELLEAYLDGKKAGIPEIRAAIASRSVFPVYFGSALKLRGVQELLDGVRVYSAAKQYPAEFGARVYKISRDAQGNRLTHMKITGGTLRVKDVLTNQKTEASGRNEKRPGQNPEGGDCKPEEAGRKPERADRNCATAAGKTTGNRATAAAESTGIRDALGGKNGSAALLSDPGKIWEQKVNQIRIYSGAEFQPVQEAAAGTICAVTGLDYTLAGQGLGAETGAELPLLEPVLSYRIELPEGTDVQRAYRQLRQLAEEEPELHISWEERSQEIHAKLMGEVQTGILQNLIRQRFGLSVQFGEGSIVYRETIAAPVVGMGHFEPLRHYAEVHLLLEPAERGSGLQFESACSTDELDRNWQRLILTHLEEKHFPGVLTGSEITDMKITLVAGRAHPKHTEGGDFRQATYRAVRQGLCRARAVLLEPVYAFRMELPAESAGRALSDIRRMYGTAEAPELHGDTAVLTGKAPVVTLRGYQSEILAYTKGRGRLTCRLAGYDPCHNAQEVIEARGYEAEADTDNPCGSVFCAHGAGFVVGWEQVPEYAHIPDADRFAQEAWERMMKNTGENAPAAESDGAGSFAEPEIAGVKSTAAGSTAARRTAGGSFAEPEIAGAGSTAARRTAGAGSTAARGTAGTGTPAVPGIAGAVNSAARGAGGTENPAAYGTVGAPRPALGASGVLRPGYGSYIPDFRHENETASAGFPGARGTASAQTSSADRSAAYASRVDDDELRAIFERTYGAVKREPNRFNYHRGNGARSDWAGREKGSSRQKEEGLEDCLLVDGYNIIFAWDELKDLSKTDLGSARGKLLDLMSNYQGYKQNHLIVVFDAYRVAGHMTEILKYHNIYVVYTKEAETADQYIEKTVREIGHKYRVTVATSDALEQMIIFGAGASRMSAANLQEELELMNRDLHENYLDRTPKSGKTYLLDGHPDLKKELRV